MPGWCSDDDKDLSKESVVLWIELKKLDIQPFLNPTGHTCFPIARDRYFFIRVIKLGPVSLAQLFSWNHFFYFSIGFHDSNFIEHT